MDPSRFILTDRQWLAIEPLCPGGLTAPGRTAHNTRLFLEAVLWIVRTDAPWRDLPPEFGNWNSAFRRFRRWVQADVFKQIFDALSDEPDMEYAMIPSHGLQANRCRAADATIVKVHRHGMGAKALTANSGIRLPGNRRLKARPSLTGRRLRSNLPRGGQIEGRMDNQDPRPRRRLGQPRAVHSYARQPLRHRRRRAIDPQCRIWCDARGQSLRQQLDHRRPERAWRADRHLAAPATTAAASDRRRDVQMASLGRKLLPEVKGIQTHSHAVGQDRHILRRDDLPMFCAHQLTMNVHRP